MAYDKLVVATGAINNTFGTPGVYENCQFLKEIEGKEKQRREKRKKEERMEKEEEKEKKDEKAKGNRRRRNERKLT